MRKFIYAIMLLISSSLFSQRGEIAVNWQGAFKSKPLEELLKEIRVTTGINFIYQDDVIEKVKVDGRISKNNLQNDLRNILSGSGFALKEFGNNSIVIYPKKKIKSDPVEHIEAYVLKEPEKNSTDSIITFSDAELITVMDLDYPNVAVKNKEQGNVNLKILVGSNGGVCKSELQESSGSAMLDSVALSYSKKLKFNPASANGKPRSTWIRMIFKYILNEK